MCADCLPWAERPCQPFAFKGMEELHSGMLVSWVSKGMTMWIKPWYNVFRAAYFSWTFWLTLDTSPVLSSVEHLGILSLVWWLRSLVWCNLLEILWPLTLQLQDTSSVHLLLITQKSSYKTVFWNYLKM